MTIVVPRYIIVGLAALFTGYMVVLAIASIDTVTNPYLYFGALALYVAATGISVVVAPGHMPRWAAMLNVLVAIAVPTMVASQIIEGHVIGADYATWYVAAIGALMVITSARGHHAFAWLGVTALVVHTVLWAGPGALLAIGVIGSVLWVAISHALERSLKAAAKSARAYAVAEREAAEWQAAQEAHLFERQFRLGQTSRMALPMLRHIVVTDAELTVGERQECLYLEGAIRDEIRGRQLLNDAVREQVMIARRRGVTVNLLDEGGIDDLSAEETQRVLNHVARAIRSSMAGTIIVRTVPEGSDVAVTVVGLGSRNSVGGGGVNLLGHSGSSGDEGDEPEIELWLEIPRLEAA